jgi:hypothetical protein
VVYATTAGRHDGRPASQSNLLNLELIQRTLELIAAADRSGELDSKTQLQFGAGILFIARARG